MRYMMKTKLMMVGLMLSVFYIGCEEEAAVAAGFQAYYDTLLSGGSVEDALKNAGEACGAGCEFVLE